MFRSHELEEMVKYIAERDSKEDTEWINITNRLKMKTDLAFTLFPPTGSSLISKKFIKNWTQEMESWLDERVQNKEIHDYIIKTHFKPFAEWLQSFRSFGTFYIFNKYELRQRFKNFMVSIMQYKNYFNKIF